MNWILSSLLAHGSFGKFIVWWQPDVEEHCAEFDLVVAVEILAVVQFRFHYWRQLVGMAHLVASLLVAQMSHSHSHLMGQMIQAFHHDSNYFSNYQMKGSVKWKIFK